MEEIILASKSPRRRELLEKYRISHKVVESNIEEIYNGESPISYVMALSLEKALNVSEVNPEKIIIGADTVVVFEDRILEKPKDEKEAFNMLRALSGKTHQVISGIALVNGEDDIRVVDYEITTVRFGVLSDESIYKYIESKEPLDKAGAYGIQGLAGLFVEGIEGCYQNVIGLPIFKLQYLLKKYFNISII